MEIIEKTGDYELLDSGSGRKLERFNNVVISRPDPQAIWQKSLPESEWKNADAFFDQTLSKGKWKINKPFPNDWQVLLNENTFILKKSVFKHIGVFPEQSANWSWLSEKIKSASPTDSTMRRVSVLNLFGYTGGASLACARAGAEVCHVDSSEFAVEWAKENRDASGLSDKPIRFIVEDVKKFVDRENRRGNKYDIVIMDPPTYGKGIKNEVWNLEEDLMPLILQIQKLLSDKPLAILLNGYASLYSHTTYKQVLETITKNLGGTLSSGELAIKETSGERLLPAGIFTRWEK